MSNACCYDWPDAIFNACPAEIIEMLTLFVIDLFLDLRHFADHIWFPYGLGNQGLFER